MKRLSKREGELMELFWRDGAMTVLELRAHSPCGARPTRHIFLMYQIAFQLTRPVWGATPRPALLRCQHHFNSGQTA